MAGFEEGLGRRLARTSCKEREITEIEITETQALTQALTYIYGVRFIHLQTSNVTNQNLDLTESTHDEHPISRRHNCRGRAENCRGRAEN